VGQGRHAGHLLDAKVPKTLFDFHDPTILKISKKCIYKFPRNENNDGCTNDMARACKIATLNYLNSINSRLHKK
jgi:hypothetical protein